MKDTDYTRGIKVAADRASEYDNLSSHRYKVSDCILCKLNVTRRERPRQNPHHADEFLRGFACALGELVRLHHEPSLAKSIMRNNGITIKDLRAAGVEAFDLEPLTKVK